MKKNDMLESPAQIEFLLYCHYCAEPHPRIHLDLIYGFAIKFLELKVIEPRDDARSYKTTELGDAWVRALLRVPMPRLVYVDTQGNTL